MEPASTPAHLLALPAEILELILTYYFGILLKHRNSSILVFVPVYRVCRGLRRAVAPFVYRSPRLANPYDACKFMTLVDEIPQLRPYVKELVLPRFSYQSDRKQWQWQLLTPQLHTIPSSGLRDFSGLRKLILSEQRWITLINGLPRVPDLFPVLQLCRIIFPKPDTRCIGLEWTLQVSLRPLLYLMASPNLKKIELNGIYVEESQGDEILGLRQSLHPLESLLLYNCVISPRAAELLKSVRSVHSFTMRDIQLSLADARAEMNPLNFVTDAGLHKLRTRVGILQPQAVHGGLCDCAHLKVLHISALSLPLPDRARNISVSNHHPASDQLDLKGLFPSSLEHLIIDVIRSQIQVPDLLQLLKKIVEGKNQAPSLQCLELRSVPVDTESPHFPETQELRSACRSAGIEYIDELTAVVDIIPEPPPEIREVICYRNLRDQTSMFEFMWVYHVYDQELYDAGKVEDEDYGNSWLIHIQPEQA